MMGPNLRTLDMREVPLLVQCCECNHRSEVPLARLQAIAGTSSMTPLYQLRFVCRCGCRTTRRVVVPRADLVADWLLGVPVSEVSSVISTTPPPGYSGPALVEREPLRSSAR